VGVPMVQRVTEVVGVSSEGVAKAIANAVETASHTVRGMRWFRATEFEGTIDGGKVKEYRALVRIYFDYETKP
jgi:dodecin